MTPGHRTPALWQGPQNVMAMVDGGGGMMEVMLPDGSWSFASDSVDYTGAVPEPGSAALLGLALALVTSGARQRRSPGGRSPR